MEGKRKSIVWHLVKLAGLWFVVGEVATIAANTYGVPPEPFAFFAIILFSIHCFLVVSETTAAKDGSKKLYSGALTWLFFGGLIVLCLRLTQTEDFETVRKRVSQITEDISDWITGQDLAFRQMKTVEHLSTAKQLIFDEGSRASLTRAQLHLRAIPAHSSEYESAQNLLGVSEARMTELGTVDGTRERKPTIETIRRELTNPGLRITLRNNGPTPVRKIRYQVAHFQISDGSQVQPAIKGIVNKTINPQDTVSVDIPNALSKPSVYASFRVLFWESWEAEDPDSSPNLQARQSNP